VLAIALFFIIGLVFLSILLNMKEMGSVAVAE